MQPCLACRYPTCKHCGYKHAAPSRTIQTNSPRWVKNVGYFCEKESCKQALAQQRVLSFVSNSILIPLHYLLSFFTLALPPMSMKSTAWAQKKDHPTFAQYSTSQDPRESLSFAGEVTKTTTTITIAMAGSLGCKSTITL